MKRNPYYQTMFQRNSVIVFYLLDIFLSIASVPRMLLEVFIRKNFGERYFSALTASFTFLFLLLAPMYRRNVFSNYGGAKMIDVIGDDITWYLYSFGFLVMCFLRWREIWHLPSEFDFTRFSYSTGDIHPRFYNLRVFGRTPDIRTIEIWLEPTFFFVIGSFLWWLDQDIGIVITVASILYSLSYVAAYKKGDDFTWDRIDKGLISRNFEAAFVDDADSSETQGFRYYGRRPADQGTRRRMAATIIEDEDDVTVAR